MSLCEVGSALGGCALALLMIKCELDGLLLYKNCEYCEALKGFWNKTNQVLLHGILTAGGGTR